jgi:hypothetical protein
MKEITFNNLPEGPFTEKLLKETWGDVTGLMNIKEGLCSIVKIDGENVLQVMYPEGKVGNDGAGAKWNLKFDRSYEEYTVEYKVRTPKDFDFVRGGKLPGLYGGSGPAGGASTAEADGFSARIMWRELGVICQYVYYVDKYATNNRWGADFIWTTREDKNMPITNEMWKDMNVHFDDRVYLTRDTWHTLKTYIKMNTPGKEDGKVICWFNGVEVVNLNLRFRKDMSFGIDQFKFTTFFGGNDETWAPKKDEGLYFKDFRFESGLN